MSCAKRATTTVILLALCVLPLAAQHGRRGGSTAAAASPLPIKGVTVTSRGTLKQLNKKVILIEAEDNRLMNFRRSGKTKFWHGDQEIKPSDIDLESQVTVDAVEDNDLKLLAVNVRLISPQKSPAPESR